MGREVTGSSPVTAPSPTPPRPHASARSLCQFVSHASPMIAVGPHFVQMFPKLVPLRLCRSQSRQSFGAVRRCDRRWCPVEIRSRGRSVSLVSVQFVQRYFPMTGIVAVSLEFSSF